MKLKHWLLSIRVNFLVFILLLPMLLSFLVLLVVGKRDPGLILGILASCILFQLGLYIGYTSFLGIIVTPHCPETIFLKRPILISSLSSMLASIWLGISFSSGLPYLTYALLMLSVSEILRVYFIARIFLTTERQPLNFWNYLTTMWVLLNPLIGIWALQRRVKNLVLR